MSSAQESPPRRVLVSVHACEQFVARIGGTFLDAERLIEEALSRHSLPERWDPVVELRCHAAGLSFIAVVRGGAERGPHPCVSTILWANRHPAGGAPKRRVIYLQLRQFEQVLKTRGGR